MSSYDSYRMPKAEQAMRAFERWCEYNGFDYAKSGYEELISSSPEYKSRIQKLDTKTANRIRFFPDYQLVTELDAHLVEVKGGKSIEKSAYDIYMDLKSIGYNVAIMVYDVDFDVMQAAKIEKLILSKPRFNDCPFIDDLWAAPRNLPDNEYYEWKKNHPRASGTTFAFMDFDATPFKLYPVKREKLA